ncbi:MAG TPA: methylated-DNA--[protein]-cysteine S-methyltransferase [Solirubrobacteraceae bacterium]|nr:methylated-DNA--[protein]-cysteine S-methyltransferase [Solirubrobacteraceae bacterium]
MSPTTDPIETALRSPASEAKSAARRFADRAAQRGADLFYAQEASPLGELLLVAGRRGLIVLRYTPTDVDATLVELAERRSPRIVESPAALDPWRRELSEYFDGARRRFEAPIDWQDLAGFRRRVLAATAAIPYGELESYKTVATKAGSPKAARAAGNALGSNPLAIVIPCHRVRHASGGLGGYTGGLERKRRLLAIESDAG